MRRCLPVACLGARCPQPTCPSPEPPQSASCLRSLAVWALEPYAAQAPAGAEKARGSAPKRGRVRWQGSRWSRPLGQGPSPRVPEPPSPRPLHAPSPLSSHTPGFPIVGSYECPTDPATSLSRGGVPGGADYRSANLGSRSLAGVLAFPATCCVTGTFSVSGPAGVKHVGGCVSCSLSLLEVFLHLGSRAPEQWRSRQCLIYCGALAAAPGPLACSFVGA